MAIKQLSIDDHITVLNGNTIIRVISVTRVTVLHAIANNIRFLRNYDDSDNVIRRVGIFRVGLYSYRLSTDSDIEIYQNHQMLDFINLKLSNKNFVNQMLTEDIRAIQDIITSYI